MPRDHGTHDDDIMEGGEHRAAERMWSGIELDGVDGGSATTHQIKSEARCLHSEAVMRAPRSQIDGGVSASSVRSPSYGEPKRRKKADTDGGGLRMMAQLCLADPVDPFKLMRLQIAALEHNKRGWAALPRELLPQVLGHLDEEEAAGFAGCKDSAALRLVCASWKDAHDAAMTRVVLSQRISGDAAAAMAVRCLPAVASLGFKTNELVGESGRHGVAVGTPLTDEGMRAVSSLTALTSLDIAHCFKVTNAGVRALRSLPALTSLNIRWCPMVTAAGVQALRNTTVAPNLDIIGWE
jgi:hypothetical protein